MCNSFDESWCPIICALVPYSCFNSCLDCIYYKELYDSIIHDERLIENEKH